MMKNLFLSIKTITYLLVGSFISFLYIFILIIRGKISHNVLRADIFEKDKPIAILGTGSSINEFKNSDWEKLKNINTIGINYFIFSEFAPNIIMQEGWSEYDENYTDHIISVLKQREHELSKTYILIKGNYDIRTFFYQEKIRLIKNIPHSLKKNLRFCVDFPVPSKNLDEFVFSVKLFKKLGIFKIRSLTFIPHLRASLGLATAIAIRFTANEIMYLGVDLIDSKNFFSKKTVQNKFKINIKQFNIKSNSKHRTNDEKLSEITIIKVIKMLKNHFVNVRFFVLTKKSQLNKIMPFKKI